MQQALNISLTRLLFLLIGLAAAVFFSSAASAQGNLLITPRRLVFDGSRKSQELNLANTGRDTARYMISLIEIEMKEDGSFVVLKETDTGRNFATPYLRFFPRSVTLAPNEAQTVKVQLVNTGQLAAGEYRSHFYFRAVPNQAPLGEQSAVQDSTSISVSITPVFGISIPAIIRIGAPASVTTLTDVKLNLKDSLADLHMIFHRTGNSSVYGNVTVEHISPSGKVTPAGIVKGLAVYTPNPQRQFSLPLDTKAGVDYHTGKLHIVYTDGAAGNEKLAETEINLN